MKTVNVADTQSMVSVDCPHCGEWNNVEPWFNRIPQCRSCDEKFKLNVDN